MALLPSELARVRYELGYSALTLSALPYASDGITAIFEQVVLPYLQSGALTYSSTAVSAQTAPTIVALTVTSPTGITVGDRLVIDQDAAQETAHVLSVAGSVVTVALSKAHAAPFPVSVEGGEAIVRGILRELYALNGPGGRISRAAARVGLKSADKADVEFFSNREGGLVDSLMGLVNYWRGELAVTLGVENLRDTRAGACLALESY